MNRAHVFDDMHWCERCGKSRQACVETGARECVPTDRDVIHFNRIRAQRWADNIIREFLMESTPS